MRPERTRAKSKNMGMARARMFLKQDLSWLSGYPVAQTDDSVVWAIRPKAGHEQPASVTLDRERLSQSQFTMMKLVGRFPEAMPKLVGDVVAWRRRVTFMLDAAKSALHNGLQICELAALPLAELPDSERLIAQRLLEFQPELRPVVQAAVWSTLVDWKDRRGLLDWLAANADWLSAFMAIVGPESGVSRVLLLADLAQQDGDQSLVVFRQVFGERRLFEVPTHGLANHVRDIATAVRKWPQASPIPALPSHPANSWGRGLVDFVDWLSRQTSRCRDRAVDLLAAMMDFDLLNEQVKLWSRVDEMVRGPLKELRERSPYLHLVAFKEQKKRLALEVEALAELDYQKTPLERVVQWICKLSSDNSASLVETFRKCLNRLPSAATQLECPPSEEAGLVRGSDVRRLFLRDVIFFLNDKAAVEVYLREVTRLIEAAAGSPAALQPWIIAASDKYFECYYRAPLSNLFDDLPARQQWPTFFAALAEVYADVVITENRFEQLAGLVAATRDASLSARYLRELDACKLDKFVDFDVLKLAANLTTEQVSFGSLIQALHHMDCGGIDNPIDPIIRLNARFRNFGWEVLIPRMVCAQNKEVFEVAKWVGVLEQLGQGVDPLAPRTSGDCSEWVERYPAELRTELELLQRVVSDAPQVAKRLLGQWIPDNADLEQEIATIISRFTEQPSSTALAQRLRNLRQRLTQPTELSPSRLTRLRTEINTAISRSIWTDFGTRVRHAVADLFYGDRLPGRSEQPQNPAPPIELSKRNLNLISAIAKLDQPYRELGLRLLRHRWSGLAWDLHTEPANQAFVARMRRVGLQMESWLSPPQLEDVVDSQGEVVRLSFESDEVELLLMGHYFNTCLSPHNFNFFSAVVNAVDVNKHVIFGRNKAGNVVARCLVAISDRGTLVTFNPYCHVAGFDFTAHVGRITQQVARDLGTVVSHSDRVSPLMTPDWYDDGAVDCGGSVDSHDAPLRTALQAATAATVMDVLVEFLGTKMPLELRLSIAVSLPEVAARPELIGGLIPALTEAEDRLTKSTLLCAGVLAESAGETEFARQMMRRYACDWVVSNFYRDPTGLVGQCLELLVKYHPTSVLRVLRQTRGSHFQTDANESDKYRRDLLSQTYRALGRHKLASELAESWKPS